MIRKIKISDNSKIFELLNQLSNSTKIDILEFEKIINSNNKIIYVFEINNDIAATATLLIDTKLIRGGSKIGYIEEVVTDAKYRGNGISKKLLQHIIEDAKKIGCYKIVLTCDDELINFYEKIGFNIKKNTMIKYLD